MAASVYLASAAIMGVLALVVVTMVSRGPGWYRYTPQATDGTEAGWSPGQSRPSLFERTETWIATFVLLTVGAIAGVMALVTDPAAPSDLTSGPVVGVGIAVVVLYLLFGTYATARQHGHSYSLAIMETASAFGALFLLAIMLQLVG